MTETISTDNLDVAARRVVEVLRTGGVAVVPTDTVYGIVADAFQPSAAHRIAEAKQRQPSTPLSVLIRSPRQVSGLVADVPDAAERLMASYWPGPLTLVFPAADGLTWDLGSTEGTVALRLPADDLLLAVIADIGPLACSGASRRGHALPSSVADARSDLGDAVDLYVDGGGRRAASSTVVAVTAGDAVVLREGAIPADHVEQVATGVVPWGARPQEQAGAPPAEPAEPAEDPARELVDEPSGETGPAGRTGQEQ